MFKEVVYTEKHWRILGEKRAKAAKIMDILVRCGFGDVYVHGSVARGDVDERSDVDVILLRFVPPPLVVSCLERHGVEPYSLAIVQPTPIHTPKLYIVLNPCEEQVISVPLAELQFVEYDFYRFSGIIDLDMCRRNIRVPGVNKNLMLIEPTAVGHREIPVIGNEGYVARVLKVSTKTILDRIEALTKRREVGHTGLFIELNIPPTTSIEEAIERLCTENQYFRKKVEGYVC